MKFKATIDTTMIVENVETKEEVQDTVLDKVGITPLIIPITIIRKEKTQYEVAEKEIQTRGM